MKKKEIDMQWETIFEGKFDSLLASLKDESERAKVIISAAFLDESLDETLKQSLVSNSSSTDRLFDQANSPLSVFSNKIDFCYRLGIISNDLARSLHLIRRIRNEFAHNIAGCSFADRRVSSRVDELYKLHKLFSKYEGLGEIFGHGTEAKFLISVILILGCLEQVKGITHHIPAMKSEWPYRIDLTT